LDTQRLAKNIQQSLISPLDCHIRSLQECQRHEAARDSIIALRRLRNTIRETGAEHGFMPDVLFGDLFEELDTLL